jgi:cytochrome c5
MSNYSHPRLNRLLILFGLSLLLPISVVACAGAATQAPSAPSQPPATLALPTSIPPTALTLPTMTDTNVPIVAPSDTAVVNTPTLEPVIASPTMDIQQGARILNASCKACHNLERVKSAHKSIDQWGNTITRMINKGARLSEEEKIILAAYLAATY